MTRLTLCAVIALFVNSHVVADAAVVKSISTGIDDATNVQIANNSPDPDFVVGLGSSAHVGSIPIARSSPLPPSYFGDAVSSSSRWLAINTGVGEEGLNVIQGTYFFQTEVNLSGFDASSAQIVDLRYGGDDKMNEITINGVSVWTRPIAFGGDFFEWHNVGSIGLGSFVPGVNVIRFNVSNEPEPPTAMALRVEGRVEAVVPEPGAGVLLAVALCGAKILQRKRARNALSH